MPSVSQSQQRLMGMAWAYSKGDLSLKGMPASLKEKIKDLAGHMKSKDLSDFAHTQRKELPERVTQIANGILKQAASDKDLTPKDFKKGWDSLMEAKSLIDTIWLNDADGIEKSRKLFDALKSDLIMNWNKYAKHVESALKS